MADDESPGKGALYRLDGRELTTVIEPVDLSNGLDWTGDRMYYADTPTQRVDLLDYDDATGAVENRRPFVTIDETDGSPDGLVLDDEGGLWLALWGGGQVRRYGPTGSSTRSSRSPPTTSPPAGSRASRLYITTAASPQPLGGSLFVAEPGVSGPPARAYAGP